MPQGPRALDADS